MGGRGAGAEDLYYGDERGRRGARYEDEDGYAGGGGGRRRGRRPMPKRRKEPEMTAAERYEREIFGELDGGDGGGGGGGARGRGEVEQDRDQIWTGVGPDGPWPT